MAHPTNRLPRLPDFVAGERDEHRSRLDDLAEARRGEAAGIFEFEETLGELAAAPDVVVVALLLSYRAEQAWDRFFAVVERMRPELAGHPFVRQQHAFALNRAGRGEEAEQILLALRDEQGPSPETNGILGRVYKDRFLAAREAGDQAAAEPWLRQAIDTYLAGHDADPSDPYPGLNALSMMEFAFPKPARRDALLGEVSDASRRRLLGGAARYWDYATEWELAVVEDDEPTARAALERAERYLEERWQAASTHYNTRMVLGAWASRGVAAPDWVERLAERLDSAEPPDEPPPSEGAPSPPGEPPSGPPAAPAAGLPDLPEFAAADRDEHQARLDSLAEARAGGLESIAAFEGTLGTLAAAPDAVVTALMLVYRAEQAWDQLFALVTRMRPELAGRPFVRQQHAFALNRAGRGVEAERILRALREEHGPSPETNGILGRVYKDWFQAARAAGDEHTAGHRLQQAIDTYVEGHDADPSNPYPGVNALSVMEFTYPRPARRDTLHDEVTAASRRRLLRDGPGYWDYATEWELAVLDGDEPTATAAIARALACIEEPWQPASTGYNALMLQTAWAAGGGSVPDWVGNQSAQLDAISPSGGPPPPSAGPPAPGGPPGGSGGPGTPPGGSGGPGTPPGGPGGSGTPPGGPGGPSVSPTGGGAPPALSGGEGAPPTPPGGTGGPPPGGAGPAPIPPGAEASPTPPGGPAPRPKGPLKALTGVAVKAAVVLAVCGGGPIVLLEYGPKQISEPMKEFLDDTGLGDLLPDDIGGLLPFLGDDPDETPPGPDGTGESPPAPTGGPGPVTRPRTEPPTKPPTEPAQPPGGFQPEQLEPEGDEGEHEAPKRPGGTGGEPQPGEEEDGGPGTVTRPRTEPPTKPPTEPAQPPGGFQPEQLEPEGDEGEHEAPKRPGETEGEPQPGDEEDGGPGTVTRPRTEPPTKPPTEPAQPPGGFQPEQLEPEGDEGEYEAPKRPGGDPGSPLPPTGETSRGGDPEPGSGSVDLLLHCNPASEVLQVIVGPGCHPVTAAGASYARLSRGTTAVLFPTDDCSGAQSVPISSSFDFCQKQFPNGSGVNDRVRSVRIGGKGAPAARFEDPVTALLEGAKVAGLYLFESPRQLLPRSQRVYADRFAAATTRFLAWELRLTHPAPPRQDVPFTLEARYLDSDGELVGSVSTSNTSVAAGSDRSWHGLGKGASSPGWWRPGSYRVEVRAGDRLLAAESFEVFAEEPKVAAAPEVAATPQRDAPTLYTEPNFGGRALELVVGYNAGPLPVVGNDETSSVRVPAGFRVTLYENAKDTGRELVLTSDTPNLGAFDFDEITSNVLVERTEIPR